ncbi:hypothetical protein EG68_07377 [Paragonimus skrjabini miyazakii]|uniref:Protein MEMO1 n=1 Tax=Paragonimus skrjabini miyazakii TaxID=59628 RepID=A0A8S9YX66_9TREM|nr:hypothetical protein EG68_07377 [Paragonimus skrjabini miyazakii]
MIRNLVREVQLFKIQLTCDVAHVILCGPMRLHFTKSVIMPIHFCQQDRRMSSIIIMIVRASSHAGLWYSDNASVLSSQLASWLDNVNEDFKPARAIIVPHAGYRHSGSCAAYAYKQIDPQTTRRIFILGPSHHANIGSKCALSPANVCRTPLADLKIDEAGNNLISIVPIVVGGLSPEREMVYGRLLAPFLRDPSTVFVISSDFCHWGKSYTEIA